MLYVYMYIFRAVMILKLGCYAFTFLNVTSKKRKVSFFGLKKRILEHLSSEQSATDSAECRHVSQHGGHWHYAAPAAAAVLGSARPV